MNTLLFNSTSANNDSPTFIIPVGGQVTVIAVGMEPDDFITFEVVQVNAGARSTVCGCRVSEMQAASIQAVLQLMCPTCESATEQPVRLTARNPVVTLDMPQDTLLRAIYNGDGLALGTVTVWAFESATPNLTDAMRGCPPVCCEDEEETWEETGERRCDNDTLLVEVQQISNCGNFRWVTDSEQPATYWTQTGVTICSFTDETTQIEEVNPCGERRLIAGPTQEWVPTGTVRCTDTNVEIQETNQCGRIRWTVGEPIAWEGTGEYDCRDFTCHRAEANQCGQVQWVDTGEPCGESVHESLTVTCLGAVAEGEAVCWNVELDAPVQGAEPLVIYFNLSGDEQVVHNYVAPVLVIAVGDDSGTVCVNTVDDAITENTLDLCLQAVPSRRVRSVPAPVCCQVLDEGNDDNSEHTILSLVCNGPVVEGSNLTWTITLNSAVAGSNLVLGTTLSGTEQTDHGYANPVVVIPVGQTVGQAVIATIDDGVLDGTRSLCLAVNANARITGGATGPVCCSVLDNDAPDSVHEVISVVCLGDVVEGQTTEWQITLDSPVTGNNLFGTTTLSGSEQALNSYAAPNFMIPVGLSTIFIGVPTNDNATVEGTRDLCLQVNTSARILAVPPPECNDVLDNDTEEPTEYTVTLDCEETEVEGSLVTWTITVSPAVADAPLSIPFALSGDETTGHSYTISPNPLVLGIGETTGEVTVYTDDDSDDEADKTLCVQALASLPRIPAASAPCCVTITDNDDPNSTHTATISCEAVEEGEDMCWTITLNAPVVGSPLNITGVLSGTEYALHTAYYDGLGIPSVTIPVGETEGEICIETLDDSDPEAVQQLCLTLGLTARLTEVTPITSCCNVTDNDTPASYPDDGYESACSGGAACCIDGTGQVRVETDGTWLWTVSCPSSFDPNYSGTWAAGTFDPADYEASISDAEGIPIGTHNGGGWYDIGVVWNYASTGPLDDFFLLGTLSIRLKGTEDIVSTMQIGCLFQVLGECV